jgi:putative oxidoreductase
MAMGLLIVRVVVGLALAAHGVQKLFGWFDGPGISSTAKDFARLGYRQRGAGRVPSAESE